MREAIATPDQIQRVDEDHVVLRRDLIRAPEARRHERLYVLGPAREIEDHVDRCGQLVQLSLAVALDERRVAVETAAAQERKNGLQPPALKRDQHGDAQ